MAKSSVTQEVNNLQKLLQEKQKQVSVSFAKIAEITTRLNQDQAEVVRLKKQIEEINNQLAATVTTKEQNTEAQTNYKQLQKIANEIELIANSDLFDSEWYLQTYTDIAKSSRFMNCPAEHYVLRGGFEGRKPCPEFDSTFYINRYPDVEKAKINPLIHYLRFGRAEGRVFSQVMQNNKDK